MKRARDRTQGSSVFMRQMNEEEREGTVGEGKATEQRGKPGERHVTEANEEVLSGSREW